MNRYRVVFLSFLLFFPLFVHAQTTDFSLLTIDRIFNSDEFSPKFVGGLRWMKSGDSYSKIERSKTVEGGTDLVSYDAATNAQTVLLSAEKLIPKGETKPLPINGYEWSADNKQMLIYTNSKKVWRLNTRGDYWVLDLASGNLKKLGGDAKPSTLMFAKFSPDGTKVGYVRENNIYVENIADGKITALTTNGSRTLINGTSDWVNEEEFFLRDCWRWSPDSKSIAYWQFDASGIKDFLLINNTDDIYPTITQIPYPKAGTTNAAVRIGVVMASGGETKWINTPGDPRQNYIAMMDWTDNSNELILQHLNRLQNNLQLMVADARSGNVKTILNEKEETWTEVFLQKLRWLNNGKDFLWMSERDGWQKLYTVSRDGTNVKLMTKGDFDVVSYLGVDEKNGFVYYIASPENATQRYLYRSKLDGSGTAEKVTPENQKGWHNYTISPNGAWAFHNYSAFTTAPKFEIVNLTNKSVRSMEENAELQAKIDGVKKGPQEFFKI
nr:DPP IV N-terminal domain-containing protein [Pyrinomonadaceae bacterium]